MRKILAMILCVALSFSIAACENRQSQADKTLFRQFLAGDIPAYDKSGAAKLLDGYLISDANQTAYCYAFFDVTDDGITELCVWQYPEQYFFQVKDGQVCHWYTETNSYSHLLDNGAFLYERHGGAPTNIRYEYYELDENAQVTFSIEFSWWDGATVEQGKVYPDSYFFDGKEVTKAEYEAKTEKYLSIGKDQIVWYNMDGTPHKTETKPTEKETQPTETQSFVNIPPKSLAETIEAEIENAYKAESLLPENTSTGAMADLQAKYMNKWKQVAEEYYNKLIAVDDLREPISDIKASWERYSREQYEAYGKVLQNIYDGGSIINTVYASYQCDMEQTWALKLVKIYQQLPTE